MQNGLRDRTFTVSGNLAACLVASVMWFASGCGGESVREEYSGPPSVSGTVTLDGVPLPDAKLSFENSDGGTFQAIASDTGQYTFESEETTPPSGKYLVRITHASEAETAGDDSTSSTLPARYNTATELIVDVFSGQNPIDFSLTSRSEEFAIEE